jgi:ribosomal protein S18 acetylase RimI-like enzyme
VAFFVTYLSDSSVLNRIHLSGWISESEPLIQMKSIAVQPPFRLKGIATSLIRACLVHFESLHVACFFAQLWHDGTTVPAAKLFVNMGFEPLMLLPRFWSQHSIDNNYKCLICGVPPCRCDAVLYGRKVGSALCG